MLRHLMQGSSWTALRAADDELGTPAPEHIPAQGDPHGDEVLEGGPQDTPEVPETPPGEAPLEPETPPAPVLEEPAPPVHKPDWRDKELSRRKRRLDEEVTAKEALAAENRRLKDLTETLAAMPQVNGENQPQPAPPSLRQQERVYTQAELDAEADRRAEIKAQTVSFQRDFNSAVESANKAYGRDNVNAAIARISELGGLDVDHLNLVLATDDPAKVLFDLGSKPEEFQRIMELPYARRAVEFTKMGLKTETPAPRVSKTPPPVEPLGGGGGSADNRYSDKVDDAAWFAAEEKRAADYAKRKRNW